MSNGCILSVTCKPSRETQKSLISFFSVFHSLLRWDFQFSTAPSLLLMLLSQGSFNPPPRQSILRLYSTRPWQNYLADALRGFYYVARSCYLIAEAGFFMSWDPVYRLVKQIPRGWVLTYGAVAEALRLPGGARTAGRAMAATPRGRGIPWHRVVGAGGRLLIREPHASLQRKLLESEGVRMTERRVDMKLHRWNPPVRKKRSKKLISRKR
jgi:methylated-DNA-protein-cysteine methyltransferase-like protein